MIGIGDTVNQADLDGSALREMCDGDVEFERELLETFLSCQDTAMAELGQAREAEDIPSIKKLAHFTKGGARSIGAPRLADIAGYLESSASGDDNCRTLALVCEAEEAYARLRIAIRGRLTD